MLEEKIAFLQARLHELESGQVVSSERGSFLLCMHTSLPSKMRHFMIEGERESQMSSFLAWFERWHKFPLMS